jgi:hypothetical protein
MKKQPMNKAEKKEHKNARKARQNARGKGWQLSQ